MRIEIPRELERFGANLFYGVQKVFELDSGSGEEEDSHNPLIRRLGYDVLHEVEKELVVIVPIKGEQLKLLQGVLYGIPHPCRVIIVSNSDRGPVDRFSIEKEAVRNFVGYTNKRMMIVHQKDQIIANAFAQAGYTDILDQDGLIRTGKAEGMIVGTMLARLTGRRFLGFIDADNYLPASVLEYVRIYAAGFALRKSDMTMVRIAWHSKPKVIDSRLFFSKSGRTSAVTNGFLNDIISRYTGFETDVIRTGNAGEHAMSMELAESLAYASGYAVETFHFIDLLEKFGGVTQELNHETTRRAIEVFQIESRSPHLHAEKGDDHIDDMIRASLGVIYHSPVTPEGVKGDLLADLRERGILADGEELPPVRMYPPPRTIDLPAFVSQMRHHPYAAFFDCETFPKRSRARATGRRPVETRSTLKSETISP